MLNQSFSQPPGTGSGRAPLVAGGSVFRRGRGEAGRADAREGEDRPGLGGQEPPRLVDPGEAGVLAQQHVGVVVQDEARARQLQRRPVGLVAAAAVVVSLGHPGPGILGREPVEARVAGLESGDLVEEPVPPEGLGQGAHAAEPLLEGCPGRARLRIEDPGALLAAAVHHGEAVPRLRMGAHQRRHGERGIAGVAGAEVDLQRQVRGAGRPGGFTHGGSRRCRRRRRGAGSRRTRGAPRSLRDHGPAGPSAPRGARGPGPGSGRCGRAPGSP